MFRLEWKISTKIGRGRIPDKESSRGHWDSDSSGCIIFSSRSYNLDQLRIRRAGPLVSYLAQSEFRILQLTLLDDHVAVIVQILQTSTT